MKEELRSKYKLIRKNISDKTLKDKLIFDKIISNEKVIESKLILIYVSLKEEVDTINLIKYFLGKKLIAVPKVIGSQIKFYIIESMDDLKKGYFNVYEPVTNNEVKSLESAVSITPGICFSKYNDRIGYGKGFYDRFYLDNKVYKIGICYKECLINENFGEENDIKVDTVITN